MLNVYVHQVPEYWATYWTLQPERLPTRCDLRHQQTPSARLPKIMTALKKTKVTATSRTPESLAPGLLRSSLYLTDCFSMLLNEFGGADTSSNPLTEPRPGPRFP